MSELNDIQGDAGNAGVSNAARSKLQGVENAGVT